MRGKNLGSFGLYGLAVGLSLLASTLVHAHEVTYLGTVLAVEPTQVQVKTVDETTKKEDRLWFVVNQDTKVKRGDRIVKYVDAKIAAGERIAVIVNHDAETKMVATEIRLAAR
jgi:hypothetical protein